MLLKNVLAVLPNFIFWKDKNLNYLGCNNNAVQLLGLSSADEIVGKTDSELPWQPHIIEQFSRHDREVIASAQPKLKTGAVLSLTTGKYIDVIIDRTPFYNEQGELAGILIVATESEKRHLYDQTFFLHLLKNVPYYIFWKDVNSVYLGSNENFAKLVGRNTSRELIGLTDFDLGWGEGEAEDFRTADKKVMQGDEQINREEVLMRPDKSEIIMLVSKVAVRNNSGDVIGTMGISTNITALKKAERELKIAKEKAELANKAKTEFISSVSHDLRTPLNVILGASDILRIQPQYPEQKEFIQAIMRAGRNLLGLIESVLDFSKLDANKLELHMEAFDLRQLIEEITAMMEFQAQTKGVELIVCYNDRNFCNVISDANAIRRILVNLIGNALKFTKQGHIKINVDFTKQAVNDVNLHLLVEDTGIGIPEDKLEMIFERFSRVEPSYKSNHAGIGLGLSIVKQLVTRLKGNIKVTSRLGEGSKFYCTLPLKLSPMSKCGSVIPEVSATRLTILIVDDSPKEDLTVYSYLIEKENASIVTSMTAVETLNKALAASNPFQIVIIDSAVHNKSPLTIAQAIRTNKELQNLLLIYLGQALSENQREELLAAGFAEILIKPLIPIQLPQTLFELWQAHLLPKNTTTVTTNEADTKKFNNLKVLLVEDDKLSQLVGKTFLEKLGCKVDITPSGKEALKLALNGYDIIFMDIGLEDMSGLDAAEDIRKQEQENKSPPVPIVALTAHISTENQQECLAAGMDSFLKKPITFEVINHTLERFFPNFLS